MAETPMTLFNYVVRGLASDDSDTISGDYSAINET